MQLITHALISMMVEDIYIYIYKKLDPANN